MDYFSFRSLAWDLVSSLVTVMRQQWKDSDSDSDYLIIQQTQNYYRYIQHLITITNNDNYNNITIILERESD